ncbi:MAG: hypothetical protein AB4426_10990 [Xenococcaceae cyanobacterium]
MGIGNRQQATVRPASTLEAGRNRQQGIGTSDQLTLTPNTWLTDKTPKLHTSETRRRGDGEINFQLKNQLSPPASSASSVGKGGNIPTDNLLRETDT